MRFVIELSLLLIIFYCTWRGYRRGAVNAAISLFAVIIAVTGGLAISSSAAPSAAYPLRPLLAGYLDSQLEAEAARSAGIDETRIEDTIKEKPELLTPYAESCLESLGFNEKRAESYCANAQKVYSAYEIDATTAAAHAGSEAVAYAICSVIFFLLIMLFISLIKQIFGLRFRITDNVDADLYGGAAFGFARGCIYCICLCWLLSFCGNMIGKTTLDDGLFSRFFLMLSNAADKLF